MVVEHPVFDLRYLYCQTTTKRMTTINQKYQIVESLSSLDKMQKQKLIEYIKGLMYASQDEASHQQLKRQALKEIRQALGKGRKLRPSF
jgi:site-specific recombinase